MTKEVQLKNRFIVISCLVIVSITFIYLYFAVTSPEGRNCLSSSFIDLSEEPVQKVNKDAYIPNIVLGSREYTIIPLAEYRIAGMVVSKKRYHRGFMSDLSPYDFCLLYTSDAADDLLCVDLGGPLNIKKKNKIQHTKHHIILLIYDL